MNFNKRDLSIDFYPSMKNPDILEFAVLATHMPTGVSSFSNRQKSLAKNKKWAIEDLKQAILAHGYKGQMGKGARRRRRHRIENEEFMASLKYKPGVEKDRRNVI